MISYGKLANKPRVFKSITGLDIDEFERLFEKLVPVWVDHERSRLDRPDRKRAIGGGRKYALKLRDRLVMVMCLLAAGNTVTEIARELSLSVKTVSTYRARIMDKLGLKSTAEIIRYALERGLVE